MLELEHFIDILSIYAKVKEVDTFILNLRGSQDTITVHFEERTGERMNISFRASVVSGTIIKVHATKLSGVNNFGYDIEKVLAVLTIAADTDDFDFDASHACKYKIRGLGALTGVWDDD